jgi:hypothetical protein
MSTLTPTSSPFWTTLHGFTSTSTSTGVYLLRCADCGVRWLARPQHDMSGSAPGNTTSIRRS